MKDDDAIFERYQQSVRPEVHSNVERLHRKWLNLAEDFNGQILSADDFQDINVFFNYLRVGKGGADPRYVENDYRDFLKGSSRTVFSSNPLYVKKALGTLARQVNLALEPYNKHVQFIVKPEGILFQLT